MKARMIAEGDLRTFALVFEAGDEAGEGLRGFARAHNVTGASISAIGAFRSVTIGYFEIEHRDYRRIRLDEQVELLSLIGNIAVAEDGPKLHAHVVVGKADGTAHGGHLLEGIVRPTLEVIMSETPMHLRRRTDPETGLALIDLASTTVQRP